MVPVIDHHPESLGRLSAALEHLRDVRADQVPLILDRPFLIGDRLTREATPQAVLTTVARQRGIALREPFPTLDQYGFLARVIQSCSESSVLTADCRESGLSIETLATGLSVIDLAKRTGTNLGRSFLTTIDMLRTNWQGLVSAQELYEAANHAIDTDADSRTEMDRAVGSFLRSIGETPETIFHQRPALERLLNSAAEEQEAGRFAYSRNDILATLVVANADEPRTHLEAWDYPGAVLRAYEAWGEAASVSSIHECTYKVLHRLQSHPALYRYYCDAVCAAAVEYSRPALAALESETARYSHMLVVVSHGINDRVLFTLAEG